MVVMAGKNLYDLPIFCGICQINFLWVLVFYDPLDGCTEGDFGRLLRAFSPSVARYAISSSVSTITSGIVIRHKIVDWQISTTAFL